jgi:hypothetical protein
VEEVAESGEGDIPVEPSSASVGGYCVRCREQVELQEPVPVVMANGRLAIRGQCPKCGGSIMRFVAGEGSPSPTA